MTATTLSKVRLLFVGITTICAVAGCADSGPQAKKPGATPAVSGTAEPKRDDPMAKPAVAEKAAEKDEVLAERNKLSPEDRKLVDAQEWCVIQGDRLGEMGPPIKLMVKGEPVFICCKGCQKDAEANPEKTLAKVKELKAKKAASEKKPGDKTAANTTEKDEVVAERRKLSPEDRKLVDAQEWCAIEDEGRLGAMGPPVKLMIKGEPVFVCCKNCQKQAEANPDKTLAKVKELKAKKAAEKKQG